MPWTALPITGLRLTVAEGVVPRWRSATGFIPRAGVVRRAGVVERDCAILDVASTKETIPEASEPKRDAVAVVVSARMSKWSSLQFDTRLREGFDGLVVEVDGQ